MMISQPLRALIIALSLLTGCTSAFAQSTKISAMPSASALGGTELVPVVQGGANKSATATQIKTFAQTGLAAVATSGSATDLTTGTIPAARLPLFGSAANGAVAASGGGTTTYLRADGTWATPAGSGTVTSVSVVTANSLSGSVATATSTPAITLDIAAFSSSTKGAVPASGGGTTNFLRADGTWAAPAGGGGGSYSPPGVSSQAGTAYTFVLGDANTWVRSTNSSAVVFTVPTNASVAYPIGTEIYIVQAGAGSASVAAAGGVTINSRASAVTLAGQYGVAELKKVLTDTWVFTGDIQ